MSYLNESKNSLFKPSKIRNKNGRASVKNLTLSDSSENYDAQNSVSVLSKNSFIHDPSGSPFKNTQQLSVDFSKFEKHTFFNSAYNKILIAINKIVNSFPFDEKKEDIDKFIESLTGFEKYIYNLFPKYVGYLNFNGLNYIEIDDYKGSGNFITNERSIGESLILDFGFDSFTIEMNLKLKEEPTTSNQIILQRLNSANLGYSLGLLSNQSSQNATLFFLRNDGDKTSLIQCQVKKNNNSFFHVAVSYDYFGDQKLKIYIDGELAEESTQVVFKKIDFSGTKLKIAKGNSHGVFQNIDNFVGSINNFRFFRSSKNSNLIKKYMNSEMFQQKDLILHYKFNEPYNNNLVNSIEISNSNILLDHSGNRMHSVIKNYDNSQRLTEVWFDNAKNSSRSPILFMEHPLFKSTFESVLSDAIEYDSNNPNLITKLIPSHYITEENNYFYGKDPLDEDFLEDIDPIINIPGGAKKPNNSIITSILFTWANTFDEIKMFIDEMGKIGKIDYTSEKSMCDHLLPYLSKQFDLELPTPFANSTIEQYTEGKNLNIDESLGQLSLQQVQNTMWRRILSDAVEIRRTKGTKNSIKSVLRNIGINPYGPFRLKEYGGSKTKKISDSYEIKQEVSKMLDFSAGALSLTTSLLVSDRVEPGTPQMAGELINGISNNPNDSLLTNASWSVEARFKLDNPNLSDQSLLRLQANGKVLNSNEDIFLEVSSNIVFYSQNNQLIPLNLENRNVRKTIRATLNNSNIASFNKFNDAFLIKKGNFERVIFLSELEFFQGDFIGPFWIDFDNLNHEYNINNSRYIDCFIDLEKLSNINQYTSASFYEPVIVQFVKNIDNQGGTEVRSNQIEIVTLDINEDDSSYLVESENYSLSNNLLFNLISHKPDFYSNKSGKLELWGAPNSSWDDTSRVPIHLEIDNINLYDGNDWYVSFGRKKSDGNLLLTSSYFLRAGRFKSSGMSDFYEANVFYSDDVPGNNTLSEFSNTFNEAGPYFAIGSNQLNGSNHLNQFSSTFPDTNLLNFGGKVSHLRFYSKFLSKEESRAHINSFKSAGVQDPRLNYNFNKTEPGSFERLRMDLTFNQQIMNSNVNSNLPIFDYSQNEFHALVVCSDQFINPFKPETFFHQILNPKLESGVAENKVRVRSFTENNNLENYNGFAAPLYEIPANEEPNDDKRVEIETSIVQALNDDIITIFSSLDSFNNYIGAPEHYFSREYRDLRNLRRIYFNRLTDKIKISTFFQFFKWFDETIGDILEELIPYNSQFMGTNFVIESHMLERSKFTYSHHDMYLGLLDRRTTSVINLQFFTGTIRKH